MSTHPDHEGFEAMTGRGAVWGAPSSTRTWLKENGGTVLWVLCLLTWIGFCAYVLWVAPSQPR